MDQRNDTVDQSLIRLNLQVSDNPFFPRSPFLQHKATLSSTTQIPLQRAMTPPSASPPRSRERQLAPGVYFTPAASSAPHASAPSGTRPVDELTLDELRSERAALLSSVQKLRASNREMQAFDPDRKDEELVQAVGENIEIIARRAARAARLQERIDVLCPQAVCDKESNQGNVREESDVSGAAAGETARDVQPGLYL